MSRACVRCAEDNTHRPRKHPSKARALHSSHYIRERRRGAPAGSAYNARMSWRIDRQANGKFAIYSTRVDDYIVIDADEMQIAQIYAEKGVKVYLASARAQMTTRATAVDAAGEAKIEASRRRGSPPKEGRVPIGVTGFELDDTD